MFREMRRKRQQLTEAECIEILTKNTSGILAVFDDNGYPYAVPLSYVYDNGSQYFHCARSGHKLDAIKSCDKVENELCNEFQKVIKKQSVSNSMIELVSGFTGIYESTETISKFC